MRKQAAAAIAVLGAVVAAVVGTSLARDGSEICIH